jgi:predicted Zn-dependent protease
MRFVWLLMLCLLFCVISGCDNPLAIDRETEIEIGREAAAELEAEYGLVTDPALQARLDSIGERVAAVSEEPDLPWRFRVLDSDEVNAVALPGGFVYIMKGMMDFADSEAQLAGVVAHEVVHADHHHAKTIIERTMTQALLAELILQKSSNSIRQAAGIAIDLQMREGYRDKEYESDEFGTRYAFATGYRADGLRSLLDKLYEEKGDPARLTWLLQSHPPLSKRIGRLDELIPQLTGKPAASS